MKRKVLLFWTITCFLAGCKTAPEPAPAPGLPDNKEPEISASRIDAGTEVIVCANTANDMIEWYDPGVSDWNQEAARKWFWKPNTRHGWSEAEVQAWNAGDPLDVKLRPASTWPGTSQVLAAVSGQLVTVASYPAGDRKWATLVSEDPQLPLSQVEVLPDGNVAVASARGNWIRVYAASQGPATSTYVQVPLTGAQGLLWDPMNAVLWAIGSNYLAAYTLGGTAASPTLTEVSTRRQPLSSKGLDLSAYKGNPHLLWISEQQGVYLYDKVSGTRTAAPGAANRAQVAATSNQAQGLVCQVTFKSATVNLYAYSGTTYLLCTKTGAAFSTAEYFWDRYQDPAAYRIATYNVRRITNEAEPNHAWSVRRPLVADMITRYGFDIFGLQEPLGEQVDHLAADLPMFSRFGVSDKNDHAYQHQDIFYRTSRFALLTSGQFWLAPGAPATLPVNTKPWDNEYHACVVTWGQFRDKATGFSFFVFNAHFDPGGTQARQESANLVLTKIAGIAGDAPVIFMGDLNTNQDTAPFLTLNNSALLQETWDVAAVKTPASRQTGNWWDANWDFNSQIDHIFVSAGWQVASRQVLRDTYKGVFPSDHYPVLTLLGPQ
jgi:endonuclease/exonuclease/phosphatase family metal-dependent hydrolase